ncbi:MAG: hypothetical protein LBK70_03555 [Clostridiales bacterium]|jgi:hypothetical protein|nr:hypothetical protein [Clostridiales bacterium]
MFSIKSKKLLSILLVANFGIIIVLGILIINKHTQLDDVSNNTPYVHSRVRDAFVSQHYNTPIQWSQNIGGSLDEQAIAIFEINDCYYIFGNSDSCDFDIDVNGGFLAILNRNGGTIGFWTINPNLQVVQVILYNNEYIILQDGGDASNTVALTRMDLSGKILNTWYTTDYLPIHAKVVLHNGNIFDPNYIVVYSRSLGLVGNQLIILSLPSDLNTNMLPPTTIIDSPYGIDYLQAYYINYQLLVFANEGVPETVHTTAFLLRIGSSPTVFRLNGINGPGFAYETLQVQPIQNGFVLAVEAKSGFANGVLHLLTITFSLSQAPYFGYTSTLNTRMVGVNSVRIIANISGYYIFVSNGQGGNLFVLVNGTIQSLQRILGLDRWIDIYNVVNIDFDNSLLVLAGTTSQGIAITTLDNNTITSEMYFGGSMREHSPILLSSNGGMIVLSNTHSATIDKQDGDVVRNFGGQDIWIFRIEYNTD